MNGRINCFRKRCHLRFSRFSILADFSQMRSWSRVSFAFGGYREIVFCGNSGLRGCLRNETIFGEYLATEISRWEIFATNMMFLRRPLSFFSLAFHFDSHFILTMDAFMKRDTFKKPYQRGGFLFRTMTFHSLGAETGPAAFCNTISSIVTWSLERIINACEMYSRCVSTRERVPPSRRD